MTRKNKTLILSASVLLAAVLVAVLVRRRGRKVYIAEPYRLDDRYYIYLFNEDGTESQFFKGTLDYVVVPSGSFGVSSDWVSDSGDFASADFVPVVAIGWKMPNGRIKRVRLKQQAYIQKDWLEM